MGGAKEEARGWGAVKLNVGGKESTIPPGPGGSGGDSEEEHRAYVRTLEDRMGSLHEVGRPRPPRRPHAAPRRAP